MSDRARSRSEGDLVLSGLPVAVEGNAQAPSSPPARRRARRLLVGVVLVVLVVVLAAAGSLVAITNSLLGNVEPIPGVFAGLDESSRPPAGAPLTVLVVGTDSRSDVPTTGTAAGAPGFVPGAQRSDVLMLLRIDADRSGATVVSVPRDSWVPIPGHGLNKVNAAYSFGGPSLLIDTVEKLTGLRVDHFAVVDFAGFEAVVDAVGGIDVGIDVATEDRGVVFHQGVNHLDGAAALVYVRQRYGLPAGDLDRARRQQSAMREVLGKVAAAGTLSDPVATYSLLDAVTRVVSVDETLTPARMQLLAFELRHIARADVSYVSAPVRGLGFEGPQSVVYLDEGRSFELWTALRDGTVDAYAGRHPEDILGASTR